MKLGPIGEGLRENLRTLRRRQSPQGEARTLRELSEHLASTSRPLALNTLSEIENGARRVDVDDLVAIAAALEVSPLNLLLPTYFEPSATVDVTGLGRVDVEAAWAWMRDGELPDGEVEPWAKDNVGAWLSRLRPYHTDDRVHRYLARLRALLYPTSTAPDVGQARVSLERAERSALRRLQEIDLLPERFSFEAFQEAYERMLLELLREAGQLDDWDLDPRPGDGPPRDDDGDG